jgi:hypothetical protein
MINYFVQLVTVIESDKGLIIASKARGRAEA